jgi:hypothetical protein
MIYILNGSIVPPAARPLISAFFADQRKSDEEIQAIISDVTGETGKMLDTIQYRDDGLEAPLVLEVRQEPFLSDFPVVHDPDLTRKLHEILRDFHLSH